MTSDSPLSVLLEDPDSSALITDVDGTLCRIVGRPERAVVPARARTSLGTLAERLEVVACVSGRPVEVVSRMVDVPSLTYIGNHGLELIEPGGSAPVVELDSEDAALSSTFIREHDSPFWVSAGIRVEDKGPIQALHWRGADERTEATVHEIADLAAASGLDIHWGRKVREIRPPGMEGKAGAVESVLEGGAIRPVALAGEDRTDLEAAIRWLEMKEAGQIDQLVLVAVSSTEGPLELVELADVVVDDPDRWLEMLQDLAG
ncbi:MAG: trehalose-phosphatase [Solirubrobacterales bacterium]